MAFTATYTTAARVALFFKDIDSVLTGTPANLDMHIQRAEGVIFAASQGNVNIKSADFAPDDKRSHAFIQGLATKITAFSALAYEPAGTDTNAQAALIADLLYTEIILDLRFLRDERFSNALKAE